LYSDLLNKDLEPGANGVIFFSFSKGKIYMIFFEIFHSTVEFIEFRTVCSILLNELHTFVSVYLIDYGVRAVVAAAAYFAVVVGPAVVAAAAAHFAVVAVVAAAAAAAYFAVVVGPAVAAAYFAVVAAVVGFAVGC
jgi:hypothetical protein